jgi:lysophospholipase L1-like esterase
MRVARIVAINVLVLLALLVVVEGAASLLVVSRRFAERWWPGESANGVYLTLPMYKDDPAAPEYWEEFRLSASQTYIDYLGWRRKDFAGRYINIVDGYRVTPGGRRDGPVLAMFGGSAMWGTGVADGDTIPAGIARALGRQLQVRNFGEAGYNATQDYLQFYLAIRDGPSPQIAVFYDGINDAHASCVNPGRNGATLEFARMKEKIEYRKGSEPRVADVAEVLAGSLFANRTPTHYRCEDDSVASAAAAAMVRTWRSIQDLGDQTGVSTYFFLQPVAFVGSSDVSYLVIDDTMRRSFQQFYAHVDEHVRALGILNYKNLSGILDNRDAQYYIDFAHVTGAANQRIADAIANHVQHERHD